MVGVAFEAPFCVVGVVCEIKVLNSVICFVTIFVFDEFAVFISGYEISEQFFHKFMNISLNRFSFAVKYHSRVLVGDSWFQYMPFLVFNSSIWAYNIIPIGFAWYLHMYIYP